MLAGKEMKLDQLKLYDKLSELFSEPVLTDEDVVVLREWQH